MRNEMKRQYISRCITYDAHFDGDKNVCQYKQAGDDELQTEVGHVTRQRDHVATVPLLKGVLRDQVPGNRKIEIRTFCTMDKLPLANWSWPLFDCMIEVPAFNILKYLYFSPLKSLTLGKYLD